MPTVNVPKKLSTLIDLLRSNGVTSFSDGNVSITFAPSALISRFTDSEPDDQVQRLTARPSYRPSKDAVELAISGIDYDPDEISDIDAEGHT